MDFTRILLFNFAEKSDQQHTGNFYMHILNLQSVNKHYETGCICDPQNDFVFHNLTNILNTIM